MVASPPIAIGTVAEGQARALFSANVPDALAMLRDHATDPGRPMRFVSDTIDPIPGPTEIVDSVIATLAEVAHALWPSWYGDAIRLDGDDPSGPAWRRVFSPDTAMPDHLRRERSPTWFRAAAKRCQSGRPPIVPGFSPSIQIRQLALAIEPYGLLIALGVGEADPLPGRLLGLARGAEWLARETSARVLVVIPETFASSTELDGINFAPLRWPALPASSEASPTDEQAHRVWPILGRPHPYSPGELLIASRLAVDPMLGGMFQHNARVRSDRGSSFLVDLLWPDGKLVVEIDGYGFHSSRAAFSSDRNRDYELIISGYLVLRLPHDEVMQDVAIAVEKIRDVVRFRRGESPQRNNTP